jgi:hypothetical protein
MTFNSCKSTQFELSIFDPMGRILAHRTVYTNYNSLDLSNFSNGIYFIQINVNNTTSTYKAIH